MKRRRYIRLLKLLRFKLESAELDEALASDHLFGIACSVSNNYDEDYVMAQIEHRLACKKVKLLKKKIKEIEEIHKKPF